VEIPTIRLEGGGMKMMVLKIIVNQLPEGEAEERANVNLDPTQSSERDVLYFGIISVIWEKTHILQAR
jgi:hypothetical protein